MANVYAKFNGVINSWRTILVGGLNRGGQGIYALDVTTPLSLKTVMMLQIVLEQQVCFSGNSAMTQLKVC